MCNDFFGINALNNVNQFLPSLTLPLPLCHIYRARPLGRRPTLGFRPEFDIK